MTGELVDWCRTHASVWLSEHRCEGRPQKSPSAVVPCVKVRAHVEIVDAAHTHEKESE